MREQSDPLADATIAEIFADGRIEHINALFRAFDQNFERAPENLPPALRHSSRCAAPLLTRNRRIQHKVGLDAV